jgi:hypothetical protein
MNIDLLSGSKAMLTINSTKFLVELGAGSKGLYRPHLEDGTQLPLFKTIHGKTPSKQDFLHYLEDNASTITGICLNEITTTASFPKDLQAAGNLALDPHKKKKLNQLVSSYSHKLLKGKAKKIKPPQAMTVFSLLVTDPTNLMKESSLDRLDSSDLKALRNYLFYETDYTPESSSPLVYAAAHYQSDGDKYCNNCSILLPYALSTHPNCPACGQASYVSASFKESDTLLVHPSDLHFGNSPPGAALYWVTESVSSKTKKIPMDLQTINRNSHPIIIAHFISEGHDNYREYLTLDLLQETRAALKKATLDLTESNQLHRAYGELLLVESFASPNTISSLRDVVKTKPQLWKSLQELDHAGPLTLIKSTASAITRVAIQTEKQYDPALPIVTDILIDCMRHLQCGRSTPARTLLKGIFVGS